MAETKTFNELLTMGGRFYALNGDSYCDTALATWKLDASSGLYVRIE